MVWSLEELRANILFENDAYVLLNLGAAAENWQLLVFRIKEDSKGHEAPDSARGSGGGICSSLNNWQVGFSTKASHQENLCTSPFLECDFSGLLEMSTLQTRDLRRSYFSPLTIEGILIASPHGSVEIVDI